VADEPVVVSKARPVKASNGVEDKTKPTINIMFGRVNVSQKLQLIAKG
jgi:type II secretory pathway component HofQ